jgi:hypothetical protein
MDALATDYTSMYNSKPGPQISGVACILTAPQTAVCNGTADEAGQSQGLTQTLSIATDGQTWISH